MARRNQGLSALLAISIVLMGLVHGMAPGAPRAVLWVLGWACLESLGAFYSVTWALRRPDKVFYPVFFGGVFLRLLSIGIVAHLLNACRAPLAAPLLTLALGYFLLSLVQLPFYSYGFR